MNSKQVIKLDVTFVAHRNGISSKTNKPYNFVELSNGVNSKTFTTEVDPTSHDFKWGQPCEATIEMDIFAKDRVSLKVLALN